MADPTPATAPVPPAETGSTLSLQTYVGILRRQRRLILAVAVLGAVFGAMPALLRSDVYASTATVRVAALDREGVFSTENPNANPTSDRFIDLLTEVEILRSAPARAQVLERLPQPPPDFDGPKTEAVTFTEIIEITITAGEPAVAAEVANLYAELFVEDRRNRSVEALTTKADELREQSAAASEELDELAERLASGDLSPSEVTGLQVQQANLVAQVRDFNRRADELGVEAALRGRGTQLVAPAPVPTAPITEGPARGALIGLALGALVGLAIAVVADTLQDRLSSKDDLAGVRPGAPVLAVVPHAELDGAGPPPFAAQEAFRYLRTGIRVFGLNADLRTVLVTSAVGEEGKSTTAAHLARTMAEAGDRVVLVDADLRRPSLHGRFGIGNDLGLSSLVLGDAELDDVIRYVGEHLAVIPAGPPVQNPGDVLGSERFARLVSGLREEAEVTVLDTPPVLPVADALIAGQLVDGAVVVGRIGVVRRRAVRELLHRLDEAGIPLVGFVANDSDDGGGGTGYGYYSPDLVVSPRPEPA